MELLQKIAEYLQLDSAILYYYLSVIIKIIFIFVLSKIVIMLLNKIVANIFKLYPRLRIDERKSSTLLGILKSVIKYGVYLITAISILETLNVPTQPILATAGLGGIAIGFGAQSLVKDVFTGFFILFEDQYSVGDYITVNGITGTVEDIGLRITRLRAPSGEQHIVPNGEIKVVTNVSRGNSLATIDIGIAYESDKDNALYILSQVAAEFYEKNKDKTIEKPEVQGIIRFGESEVVIRTIVKTLPLMHWQIERELRMMILEAFKKEGIEIPYPKRILVEKK